MGAKKPKVKEKCACLHLLGDGDKGKVEQCRETHQYVSPRQLRGELTCTVRCSSCSSSCFTARCKCDTDFPTFLHYYHCNSHHQAICGKVIVFNHVMTPVVEIINDIHSKVKQHRIMDIMEELSAQYCMLTCYSTKLQWLSREQVLQNFCFCILF